MPHITLSRRAAVFAAAALALSAGIGGAQTTDCIDVNALPADANGSRTISAPGNYCLTANIWVSGLANGITIASGTVVLDLKGFTITKTAFSGIGIYALDRSAVTVRNGTVVQFQHGLVLAQSSSLPSGLVVEDMHFLANGTSAVNVSGTGALVRRNVIQNSGWSAADSWAIGLLGRGHRVMDNDIVIASKVGTTGAARGIWVNGCRNVVLLNNRITQADWGILFDGATGVIRDNLVFDALVPYLNLGGYGYTDAGNNH